MHMHRRPDLRLVFAGPVQIEIDGKKVLFGQLVGPLDEHRQALAHLKRGTGNRRAVAPDAGRGQVAMDLNVHFSHGHTIVGNPAIGMLRVGPGFLRTMHRERRQRIDKAGQPLGMQPGPGRNRMGRWIGHGGGGGMRSHAGHGVRLGGCALRQQTKLPDQAGLMSGGGGHQAGATDKKSTAGRIHKNQNARYG